MEASSHSVAFARTLLTQAWDENEGEGSDGDSHDTSKEVGAGGDATSNGHGVNQSRDASGMPSNAADESFMFEVDGDDYEGVEGDNDDDSFALMTQQNDRFKDDGNGNDAEDNTGSSDDESNSSSSDSSTDGEDSSSDSDSSSCVQSTPLQVRRARNIKKQEDFVKKMHMKMKEMMNGSNGGIVEKENKRTKSQNRSSEVDEPKHGYDADAMDVVERDDELETTQKKHKKSGMLFNPSSVNKRPTSSTPATKLPLTTKSLVDELTSNYPNRTNQIHILCSQIVTTIQKTKFAYQIRSNNVRSIMGNTQYSEASYQGNIKLAAPSPILITGPAGVGKTSIVRDAMGALQDKLKAGGEGGISFAFVDCASSESGSVAAVMNSAYRQLYECYHTSVFGSSFTMGTSDEKSSTGTKGVAKSNKLGCEYFDDRDSDESHNEDDGLDAAEDLIERARKWGRSGKKAKSGKEVKKANKKANTTTNNVRQTRSTLASKAASKPTPEKSSGLSGSTVHIANKNTQNSGSVALFGRATSALLQGGTTNNHHQKKSSSSSSNNGWRCAFLVLDNADRILSWRKPGSINPLTQLLMLPNVMGINLTIMLISRSTIFQYSSVHKTQATILDATHPLKIHFSSYTSVEMIKSILQVPHVQQSIIGRFTTASQKYSCASDISLRSKLNDVLYTSMLNSFVPAIKSTTQDMTEIMRLGRLLWPEYVAPLERRSPDGNIDDSLRTLMIQVLLELRRDMPCDPCHNSNCRFCRHILHSNGYAANADINTLRQRLSEKLDRGVRESMRYLLSNTAMMPGRVLQLQNIEPYAKRLPYTTKFLLLAAFLCQNKRPEQDVNLFTTKNTGKSKRKRKDEGLAYASSSKEMKQRQPSFPLERLLSVFYSIIGQYGQHFMVYKETGVSNVAQLGTERLFQSISQLITTGIICNIGSVKFNEKFGQDLMEMASAKFTCTISRADARVIATSVNFPLEKYCP